MEFRITIMTILSFIRKLIPKNRLIDVELIKTPIQGEYQLRMENNSDRVHSVSKMLLNGIVFPDNYVVDKNIREIPFLLFPGEVIQYSIYSSIENIFETENHFEIHIKDDPDEIVLTQTI